MVSLMRQQVAEKRCGATRKRLNRSGLLRFVEEMGDGLCGCSQGIEEPFLRSHSLFNFPQRFDRCRPADFKPLYPDMMQVRELVTDTPGTGVGGISELRSVQMLEKLQSDTMVQLPRINKRIW